MGQASLTVERLLSQARNPTHGQADKGLVPQRVYNLVPDRMGGYAPFGRRTAARAGDGAPLQLPNVTRLLGLDETGVSTFLTPQNRLQLYWGPQLNSQAPSVPTFAGAAEAVHLDAAGAYLDRKRFLVLSRELAGVRVPAQPIVSPVTVAPAAGSPLARSDAPAAFIDAEWGDGELLAVSARAIWKRAGDGSWTKVYQESVAERGDLRRVAYGGGRWLVVQARRGTAFPGRALVSTNAGASWTASAFPASFRLDPYSLVYAGASTWAVGGRALHSNEADGDAGLLRSADGGVTWPRSWTDGSTRGRFSDLASTVGYPDAPASFLIAADNVPSGRADPWVSFDAGLTLHDYGVPHNYPAFHPGNAYRVYPEALRLFWTGAYSFTVVHRDGRVSKGGFIYPGAAHPGNTGPLAQYTSLTEAGGVVRVNDVAHDKRLGTTVAVGQATPLAGGPAEARAWSSTDGGASWARLAEVEAALTSPARAVTIDGDGNAWYFSAEHEVNAGARVGLAGGVYHVTTVSYFSTHAGRFAYDLRHAEASTDDGGRIDFTVLTREEIIEATEWLRVDEAAQPLVDDLRFDAYIQRAGEEVGGEPLSNTIRYAFTERFPAAGEKLERTIDEMPLGQQLLTDGQPTTAIFEKGLTALHNGRVWGMASQDEARWRAQGDDMSYELANQAHRFVLAYTEIGWANLMSDRSYIPIQPTQSSRLTGLLSTPSGLLVMFENEMFLVTGDPAFGNVSVELYLDLLGCDEGTHPCKVGGVPFVIWNGKVWALQAGQAQQLGAEQWLRDDPFVRLSPEPQTRSLLALTESGLVFRYMLDDQFWLTDPVTREGSPVVELLTNCTCASGDNTRFVLANGDTFSTRVDGAPDTPHVLYADVDFGALDARSALYLVKAGFEGPVLANEFDRSAPTFDASRVPALLFAAANEANAPLAPVDPLAAGGLLPYRRRSGGRTSNTLTWRLPLARTRGSSLDIRLELRGFARDDVLKLPLQLIFASGGALR